MRNVIAALFLLPALMFTAGSSNAVPAGTGQQSLPPSMVAKVACGPFWGRHCPPFRTWTCNRWGRCWCARCG